MVETWKHEQRWCDWLNTLEIPHVESDPFEVLGERALSQGHVDILLKQSVPVGTAKKVAVEVKRDRATLADLDQLVGYVQELGYECIGCVLIASGFPKAVVAEAKTRGVRLVSYRWNSSWTEPRAFDELVADLELHRIA